MSVWREWTSDHRPEGYVEYKRPALGAGPGYVCAVEIEKTEHHNGSGEGAFGGADSWPAVRLRMPFPDGREDLQQLFIDELKTFVDAFLEKHNLGGG